MAEYTAVQESSILSEAITNSKFAFWVVVMNEEIESIYKNQTWDLVKLPEVTKMVGLLRSLYSSTSVLCIVGNFHMVLLFFCYFTWMTCLLLLKASLRLKD